MHKGLPINCHQLHIIVAILIYWPLLCRLIHVCSKLYTVSCCYWCIHLHLNHEALVCKFSWYKTQASGCWFFPKKNPDLNNFCCNIFAPSLCLSLSSILSLSAKHFLSLCINRFFLTFSIIQRCAHLTCISKTVVLLQIISWLLSS